MAKQVEDLTGSLSSGDDYSIVCPYLIGGLRSADVPQGPLSQFQHVEATEAGTLYLLKSINSALTKVEPGNAYDDARLKRIFERWWPDLRDQLNALPSEELVSAPMRTQQEIIEETLSLVRVLVRQADQRKGEEDAIAAAQQVIKERHKRSLEHRDLPELRDFISSRRAALASFMEQGASLKIDGNLLTVTPSSNIFVRYLTDNCKVIGELATELYGRPITAKMMPL